VPTPRGVKPVMSTLDASLSQSAWIRRIALVMRSNCVSGMRPPGSLPRVSDPLASEAVEDADADTVAAQLAKGPYMLGERLSAADILWGSALTFMSMFKLIPERKEFTDYVARIVARPAAQRAEAKDKELGAKAA